MAETSNGPSAFHKFQHWRHRLMDISMLGLAVGAFAASGGTTALLDPVMAWIKMHFVGLAPLLTDGPGFLSSAFQQASQGVWFTGAQANMAAMHAPAMGAAAAPAVMDHSMHMAMP